ncbi:hypothetical protein D3C71_449060 [compost metagenome]
MELFIVVVDKGNNKLDMLSKETPEKVLECAANLGKDDKDPRTVRRIFSINEYGLKTSYEVVFDGKLKLERVPGVQQKA